jgi:hypothetical protein
MHTHRQTLFHPLSTPAAPLAGVGGIHRNQLATSLFHFVGQHLGEHAQTCIMRGEREMPVRVDELELVIFKKPWVCLDIGYGFPQEGRLSCNFVGVLAAGMFCLNRTSEKLSVMTISPAPPINTV